MIQKNMCRGQQRSEKQRLFANVSNSYLVMVYVILTSQLLLTDTGYILDLAGILELSPFTQQVSKSYLYQQRLTVAYDFTLIYEIFVCRKQHFLFLFLASRSGFAFPVPTTPWRGAWWVGDPIGWGNLVADLTDLTVVSRGISPSAGLRWLWCVNSRIKMDQVFMFSPFSILFRSVLIASSLSPPLTCSSMSLMSTPEIEQTQTNHPMRHISWYIPKSPIRHHKTSKKSKNIHESI